MGKEVFSIIGCQHPHVSIFIEEMLDLGHTCAGVYEADNKELAQSIADKYNIQITDDMESLLAPEVSVVGCASINNEKINVIEKCEERGINIMVDKPLVTNGEDFKRVEEVINRKKIQIGMLLTERFRNSFYTLKQKIERGDLGDIVSIQMRKPHQLRPETRPQWHFSKEQCGGIVIDLFVHDFDLLRWLTNQEVVDVNGIVTKNILSEYPTFYDTATLQVLLGEGIMANLYADWHTPDKSWTWGDGRVFIVGTKGTVEMRLAGDALFSEDEMMIQITDEKEAAKVEIEKIPTNITEDFLNRIGGKESLISHADILATVKATLDADDQAKEINNME